MISNFRSDAGLSRATVQYSEEHWEVGFVRKARASEAQSFQTMMNTFMMWRDQINHPEPERAIHATCQFLSGSLRILHR